VSTKEVKTPTRKHKVVVTLIETKGGKGCVAWYEKAYPAEMLAGRIPFEFRAISKDRQRASGMKTLVAIMTCWKPEHRAKAQAQRETWVPALRAMGHDVLFFLGTPPCTNDWGRDEMPLFGVDDGYTGLTQKVKAICSWAADEGYDQLVKVDDDVYIVPQRFQGLPLGKDYIGKFRSPYGQYPAHFASGFSYCLSRLACKVVAKTPWNGDWLEERWIATALAYREIWGYTDRENYCVTAPPHDPDFTAKHPLLNGGTFYCEYGADDIRKMHTAFKDAQPIWPSARLEPVPRAYVSTQALWAAPTDSIPAGKLL
jgi:hypothetical protein